MRRKRVRDYAKEWLQRQVNKPHPWMHQVRRYPDDEAPAEVMAERETAYSAERDRTAELMGDPRPGRSAYFKRISGLLSKTARHPDE